MRRRDIDISALSGANFNDSEIARLFDFAEEWARSVGTPEMRPALVLKRLKVIKTSAAKILKHSSGDSLDAQLIRNELVLDEMQDDLRWLIDEVKGFEQAFERFAKAESAHRPRDDMLDSFVAELRYSWKLNGGKGRGSFPSAHVESGYDGALLRLVRELLKFGGCTNFPSDAKIHATIKHLEKHPYQGVTLKKS